MTTPAGRVYGRDGRDPPMGRLEAVLLVSIVMLAFGLRLHLAVGSPLIYDEYQWMEITRVVDLRPAVFNFPLHGDTHPPGQVYWAALTSGALGPNLLGYRAPAVILGTVAVLVMYFLGARVGGRTAGLVSAFLLATNEYHIGISALCTEKTYLTFALIALLLFDRALQRPTVARFLALGTVTGLALVTKQSAALLAIAFGFEILRRPDARSLLRCVAPWIGVAAMLVVASPDILWNLGWSATDPGAQGASYQLSKLSVGGWSWGPASLFLRPLYAGSDISEYASMTSAPGLLLLAGAFSSVFFLKSPLARFLQALGFGIFLLFSLFSHSTGEFWWADLTVLPFVVLTAGVLARLRGRGQWIGALVLLLFLVRGLTVALTRDSYYPYDWGAPATETINRARNRQRQLVTRNIDHLELCTFLAIRLPVCSFYRDSLSDYSAYLATLKPDEADASVHAGWRRPPDEDVAHRRALTLRELQRFVTAIGPRPDGR